MVRRNRKHSVIDKLPPDQKDAVEQMLLAGYTYAEIVDYLAENGVSLSQSSICRYARGYHADLEKLNIAQESMRGLMEEINRYPELDTTEAIIRMTSHNVLRAISELPPERWQEVDPEDLLRQANGLIRAAAYKTNIDMKTRTNYETGMEAVKELVFDAMAKEDPKLYTRVAAFLNKKKEEGAP
ncbi:DUF3486 family protein [Ruminococcaceae bacterium OttesenSCG-928-D13]|nr:DUF3486 family protein [Ruminococcaceae bacterium OttesenSCG-928-D13]